MRIVARHVSALAMGFETGAAPDFLHAIEADSVAPGHQAAAPMASSRRRFALHAFADDPLLQRGSNAAGSARPRLIHQPLETLALEAFAPFDDVAQIQTSVLACLAQRRALREQQHGSEPAANPLRNQPGTQKFFDLLLLSRRYLHSCLLHPPIKHSYPLMSPLFTCHYTSRDENAFVGFLAGQRADKGLD